MAQTRRAIERRVQPRVQVIGALSGRLEVARPLRVVDIGIGGALIESTRTWPVGSVHPVVIADDVAVGRARLIVRHVRKVKGDTPRFILGVEFVSVSPELAAAIAGWVAAGHGD